MKILIADDDITSRLILKAELKSLGFSAITAENGNDAWLLLEQQHDIHLAILDWIMPGMTGIEICEQLKQSDKRKHPVYVILLTSMKNPADIAKGLESGADDYMAKPFNSEELKARIGAGIRIVGLQLKMIEYTEKIEQLANARAAQLMHADRMATIGLLTAGMAHEINNPATFISVCAQTIEENWDKFCAQISYKEQAQTAQSFAKEMPAIIKDIKNGVERIQDIVNGLKVYSHIESEERKALSIQTVIEQALHFAHNRLKVFKVIVHNAPDLPQVMANQRQLEQVLINILINAADALSEAADNSREKKILVTTEVAGKKVLVIIENNGPEIPENRQADIFKPFFTTKKVGEGTGLGLSICRSIIEDHNGEISVDTPPGGGVRFFIKIPFIAEEI